MSVPLHNLNIQSYSLDEMLGLFELDSYDISIENLKAAKRKVLMLHPDKSKLDAKYFLFYKKAFDVIVQFYDNQNRQNRSIQPKDVAYDPDYNSQDTNTTKHITKNVQEMNSDNFQDKFNELFGNVSKAYKFRQQIFESLYVNMFSKFEKNLQDLIEYYHEENPRILNDSDLNILGHYKKNSKEKFFSLGDLKTYSKISEVEDKLVKIKNTLKL